MLPAIEDIADQIKKSGTSQRKICIALKLDVTWLNKVLKKKIPDPSYKKIKTVFDYLEKKASVNEKTADEVCAHPLITVKIGMTLGDISKKLQKNAFDQAPVKDQYRDDIIGVITSKMIVELLQTSNFDKKTFLKKEHVKSVLTVPYDYPAVNLVKNLGYHPCILVEKNGKKYGIITDEDMMMHLFR